MKEPERFTCSKCEVKFRGPDSFHGEYRVKRGDVKNVQLCLKCLDETIALWNGEFNNLRGQIEREIELCVQRHRIDRNANARRTANEKVLDLIDNSVMFNGYSKHSGYNADLSSLELEARRIIHGDLKINFEEQVRLRGGPIVDGYIELEKNRIVLEFDGWRHELEEQKERDRKRDANLIMNRYRVVRIPEKIIKNDKSGLMTSILDALYGMKRQATKEKVPQIPLVPTIT